MTTAHVPFPALEMREETPVSAAFGDVYFSREGGVAETQHVFLQGNGLPGRWQSHPHPCFTIAELGFGTGLNFLVTLRQFRETAPAGLTLHYHAVEKFPFSGEQLAAVLALQPALQAEACALLAAYPLRVPGPHRIFLDRVVLTLWFGEVEEWLPGLRQIDAWYLDGFSPARNPDMWQPSVFTAMARASQPQATVATFTAASAVRQGLTAAGFAVEKVRGFGKKRDMLRAQRTVTPPAIGPTQPTRRAVVIGAGIAGASMAHSLARRGYHVEVFERSALAAGASGNAAGVLFPPLTKQWSASTAFYFTAYGFALRQLAAHGAQSVAWASPGMLRLPRHAEEEAQLRELPERWGIDPAIVQWCPREQASEKAGVALPSGAAYFPQGTWVCPREWCAALLQHEAITVHAQTGVTALTKHADGWRITCADGAVHDTPLVVVAAAVESAALLADYGLRLQPVGGQISEFAAADTATMLRSILCRKGYVIGHGAQYLAGATYHREALQEVTDARHAENLAELHALLPGWFHGRVQGGRSAVRATTPDRLPYIGRLAEGLYVSTGHGSRGLLSAPLGAELIASRVAGEALPVTEAMAAILDPLR